MLEEAKIIRKRIELGFRRHGKSVKRNIHLMEVANLYVLFQLLINEDTLNIKDWVKDWVHGAMRFTLMPGTAQLGDIGLTSGYGKK